MKVANLLSENQKGQTKKNKGYTKVCFAYLFSKNDPGSKTHTEKTFCRCQRSYPAIRSKNNKMFRTIHSGVLDLSSKNQKDRRKRIGGGVGIQNGGGGAKWSLGPKIQHNISPKLGITNIRAGGHHKYKGRGASQI